MHNEHLGKIAHIVRARATVPHMDTYKVIIDGEKVWAVVFFPRKHLSRAEAWDSCVWFIETSGAVFAPDQRRV